ncbi:MAG: hypothetical protein ACFFA0_02355 [Promethearchaeota archaeon]
MSSKSARKKRSKKSLEEISPSKPSNGEIEITIESNDKKQEIDKLGEIPQDLSLNLDEIPSENGEIVEESTFSESQVEYEQELQESKKQILQEIAPKPFQSSIISSKKEFQPVSSSSEDLISDAMSELKQSMLPDEEEQIKPSLTPIPTKTPDTEQSISKQKRLEKDMTEVLSFLSKKISVKKLKIPDAKPTPKKEFEKKIPPASMNEILNELGALDSRIEASAIIKTDGTMLASAISNRISDSLFSTIGINLSMISSDIINGLSAGTLKSISVKGSEGVLDLAPIDKESENLKDMILILFSHPDVKSGIISVATNLIKKQIKYYLGLEK